MANTGDRPGGLACLFTRVAEKSADTRPMREFGSGLLPGLVAAIGSLFVLLYIYFAGFGYFSPESFVALYIGFSLTLIFLLFGARSTSPKHRPSFVDWCLIVLTIISMGHYIIFFPVRFVQRFGIPEWHDILVGCVAIFLVIEACRRILGLVLPILSSAMILYMLLGGYVPGLLGHSGFSITDTVGWLYSNQSIFGSITRIFATFVFLFIIFGTLLERSGGRALFIDLPLVFIGRMTGGPAKVSVVASAMFGMISGATVANIASTGQLTIPLMKRAGYPRHVAGAFETTASTIGVTMPPLMGAAIFIMAEFTGIPYIEIVKASILPSLLFMMSLLFVAGAYAKKHDIGTLPAHELGDRRVIVRGYWSYAIPVVVLVVMLVRGYSPDMAVFAALPTIVVANLLSRPSRLTLKDWVDVLSIAARRSLMVGGLAGCLGIIIGVVVKTALATKLSYIVVDLSGGYLIVGILLTALVTFILGMGVSSVTADYLLLSILVAPALLELGAPLMAAHLLIIWFSQTSNLTPPVCAGAFTAAGIAQADPWRTAFFALKIGLFLYILPLNFVYGHILNLEEPILVFQSALSIAISALCFAGAVVGYLRGELSFVQRLILAVGMFALYEPGFYGDIIGMVILLVILFWQTIRNRGFSGVGASAGSRGHSQGTKLSNVGE